MRTLFSFHFLSSTCWLFGLYVLDLVLFLMMPNAMIFFPNSIIRPIVVARDMMV